MNTENDLFDVIKVGPFFKKYCPEVTNFYHKTRKEDGNRRPIDFDKADKAKIREAAKKLASDLRKLRL